MSRSRVVRTTSDGMKFTRLSIFAIVSCCSFLPDYAKAADNSYFFSPAERSYADIQPAIYDNSRQDEQQLTDRSGGYGTSSFEIQDPRIYSQDSFPSPHYNQNPEPFHLHSGRSQTGGQFYLNQPDYKQPYRATFRTYPIPIEVTTRRPEIHSYQHDPSQPEVFLGQITLNNPDTENYNSGSKYRNVYDENTLKSGNPQMLSDVEFFNSQRITTYNPNRSPQRSTSRPRIVKTQNRGNDYFDQNGFGKLLNTNDAEFANSKQSAGISGINNAQRDAPSGFFAEAPDLSNSKHIPEFDGFSQAAIFDTAKNVLNVKKPVENESSVKHHTRLQIGHRGHTTIKPIRKILTSNKGAYTLQPLLEEISDFNVHKDPLEKYEKGSDDVEIVQPKENNSSTERSLYFSPYDSNPSASTVEKGNARTDSLDSMEEIAPKEILQPEHKKEAEQVVQQNSTSKNESQATEIIEPPFEEELYYEYEDTESTTEKTKEVSTLVEEYEDETENPIKEETSGGNFEILNLSQNKTMVEDDKFKDFVDKPMMDNAEMEEPLEVTTGNTIANESIHNKESIEQEVVSVVTTKSVVNGTYSVPEVTSSPVTVRITTPPKKLQSTPTTAKKRDSSSTIPSTTENWVVVASVQTSRSVSGAIFLPFPAVEQEETKQVLVDEERVTQNPMIFKNSTKNPSTENIIDKLDGIQSELASSVLSGNFKEDDKNIAVLKEIPITKEQSTAATPIKLFTLKSTTSTSSTERSAPEPPPVTIKKFAPFSRSTTTTTQKPRRKQTFEPIKDELSHLLPPGFKPKPSFKDNRKKSTTSTTEDPVLTSSEESLPFPEESNKSQEMSLNSTQGRSSGLTAKNKFMSALEKPKTTFKFKKPEPRPLESLLSTVTVDDLSKFLPPGFKLDSLTSTTESIKVKKGGFLDQLFQPKLKTNTTNDTEDPKNKILAVAKPVDITSFLPPGFKLDKESQTDIKEDLLSKAKTVNINNFLPPGYSTTRQETSSETSTSGIKPGFKPVFPSRPGGKTTRKTTPKPNGELGPGQITPVIQKGWPTRASTEFTGWPTPSTTPFSIEKLLAERNATASTYEHEEMKVMSTSKMTSTTTSTTTKPPSTTPGFCTHECDLAATIKIVGGVKWVPELLDHHTNEWKQLADEVSESLNSVYASSDDLKKWYKGVRIEAFNKGSVLVDYFVELNNVNNVIDTVELKQLFHKSLTRAKAGSVVVEVNEEKPFDSDMMVGDQPEEERLVDVKKTVDISDGKLQLGKFVMDPTYTEFIVLPKRVEQTFVNRSDPDALLPQWGIAVIVIALASLLFVAIFGVTVLVNRQKSAKAKQPIPLSEDMLRELDKSHMGGLPEHPKDRDLYVKEREPYPPPGKRLSASMLEQFVYQPGDSWRSEWTPQLQKYMQQQHYAPDSGRGSQIYGAHGNMQYGYGSQIYGYAGSQVYGYQGEGIPRTHFSRRRSAYDGGF